MPPAVRLRQVEEDRTRNPDTFLSGPGAPLDGDARRRFFRRGLAPCAAAQVLHYHPGVQQCRDFFPGEAVLQQYF